MADTAELTFETIMSWSPEEMRKQFKDPAIFAQANQVIAQKSAQDEAVRAEQTQAIEDAEQQRLARRLAAEEREAADELVRQEETKRWANLTREERINELAAKKRKEDEEERARYLAQVAREKEQARLSRLRPEEIEAERIAKESAEEKAEAERLAAEQAEAEAQAAAQATAEKELADKTAAERADAEKKVAEEKVRLEAEAVRPKEKIVRDYQIRDENGNVIGRPTHLEADTWEEMAQKLQVAHENAMRFAERLKKRQAIKPEFRQAGQTFDLLSEEQLVQIQKDLNSDSDLAIAKAKAAVELNEARKTYIKNLELSEGQKAQKASFEFMAAHPEYNRCEANAKILGDYLQKENLTWTASNLEIAYAAMESQMAPSIQDNPVDTAAIDNEVEAARQAEATRAAQTAKAAQEAEEARIAALVETAIQKRLEREKAAITAPPASVAATASAVVSTPVENTSAASNTPAVVRKLPVAGIEPGSLHGSRPTATSVVKPVGITKQDIIRMSRDEYKKKMRDPKFVAKVNELFGRK